MALTVTHIAGQNSTANNQTLVAADTITPVEGRYYLVITRQTSNTQFPATPANTITHGGSGLTLTRVAGTYHRGQEGATSNGHLICAFDGFATASPTGGVLTLDASVAATSHTYECLEITGAHATTPIPQDDVGSSQDNTAAGLTITLAGAFQGAGSFTLSALGMTVVSTDPVIPTGWTSLQSRAGTGPTGRLTVAYENANDSTADWTGLDTGGTQDVIGFILEIAEAAAGGAAPQVARLIGGSVLTDGLV